MALLEKQLFIKTSTIPNAGKGLFTRKAIPKGTRIVEYTGRRSAWKDVKDEDGRNGYIFYINRNNVIDAQKNVKAFARYANDARGLVRIKGILNNSDYVVDGLKAYIESTKDIPAGGEILVDYGKDYWKVIRENIKLRKAEEKELQKEKEQKEKESARKRNGIASKKLNGVKRNVKATAKKKKQLQ